LYAGSVPAPRITSTGTETYMEAKSKHSEMPQLERISAIRWMRYPEAIRPYTMLIYCRGDTLLTIVSYSDRELFHLLAILLSLVPWSSAELGGPRYGRVDASRRFMITADQGLALSDWILSSVPAIAKVYLHPDDAPIIATAILKELLND